MAVGCGAARRSATVEAEVGAQALGQPEAPVLMVEFGDYQCGPCATLGRRIHEVLATRPAQLRFVFRHCPARRHPIGRQAALVAAAAAEGEGGGDRFWTLHWLLVREGPVETEDQLWRLAQEAGLSPARLREIIATGRPDQVLERDLGEADRLEVRGMPTMFVNGRRVEGAVTAEQLLGLVRQASR